MELKIEYTLSELVQKHPAAVALFEKYDLDYCCHGKQTLQQACEGDLIKYQKVEQTLKGIMENKQDLPQPAYETMDVSQLIDHIVNKHHHYLNESMPRLFAHLEKVSTKHGSRHPEATNIFKLFAELKQEMEQHMLKEERILFPRIKSLNEQSQAGSCSAAGKLNLSEPIHVMEMEHEKAGSILHLIRELSNNYTPPVDACTTYQLGFRELKELEDDLHMHVHLENNILFPKAIEMQRKRIHSSLN